MTNVLLVLAAIPLGAFIYRYARFSPWASTWQGRILFSQKIAMLALVLFYLTAALFGDYPGRELVKFLLLTVLMVLFWAMLVSLIAAQTEQPPVSKKRGQGLVPPHELEMTKPRRRKQ